MLQEEITERSAAGRRYALVECLGEGSFGIVYQAFDVKDKQRRHPLAVKRAKLLDDEIEEDALSRTAREAALLQKANHPHIVRYHDHCLDPPYYPYVVMEYAPHSLASIPFSQEVLENYIRQLPHLLRGLQESEVAHCDLQSGNVLVFNDWQMKLSDFGLAVHFNGTVYYPRTALAEYHAPELRRWNMVTPRTDMYNAGRIIEKLATGEYSPSPKQAIQKMRDIHGITPPESFQRLLRKMLRKEHFCRPSLEQLEELTTATGEDLQHRRYFNPSQLIPIADAGIGWMGSQTSSNSS